jgi:hypothetical protein
MFRRKNKKNEKLLNVYIYLVQVLLPQLDGQAYASFYIYFEHIIIEHLQKTHENK